MPIDVLDDFEKEERARLEEEARLKQGRELADAWIGAVRQFFKGKLVYRIEVSPGYLACYISESHSKRIFGRTSREVIRIHYRSEATKSAEIVVFTPAHKEIAMKLASIFAVVYTDNLTVRITRFV
jgi:hypothetical protein